MRLMTRGGFLTFLTHNSNFVVVRKEVLPETILKGELILCGTVFRIESIRLPNSEKLRFGLANPLRILEKYPELPVILAITFCGLLYCKLLLDCATAPPCLASWGIV